MYFVWIITNEIYRVCRNDFTVQGATCTDSSHRALGLRSRSGLISEKRKVLGWPRRCELAHAFRWECSYKRLKLAQHLARHGASLTEEVKTEVGAFVGQIPDIRYIFKGGAAAANRTCICTHPGILRYVWCVD